MNGSQVRMPFMSSTSKQHVVCRLGYYVLRLPYARDEHQNVAFSMYIYLPNGLDTACRA
jgi:serpin B